MAIHYSHGQKTAAAQTRLIVSALVGISVGGVSALSRQFDVALLLAWGAAALTYLIWMWLTVYRLDVRLTRDFALREDPSRRLSEIVLVLASLASLGGVLQVLFNTDRQNLLPVGLSVLSVLVSWLLVHTIYMLRYAEEYYREDRGGVDFPGTKQPTFQDFAYLAFTMGMTYQVSDTTFGTTNMRGLALKHALISYLFGTVIVATTINLVISIGAGK